MKSLQEELTVNPSKGDVIQGTGGLRKIRFAFENRGKSGSVRVCYVDFVVYGRIRQRKGTAFISGVEGFFIGSVV